MSVESKNKKTIMQSFTCAQGSQTGGGAIAQALLAISRGVDVDASCKVGPLI